MVGSFVKHLLFLPEEQDRRFYCFTWAEIVVADYRWRKLPAPEIEYIQDLSRTTTR